MLLRHVLAVLSNDVPPSLRSQGWARDPSEAAGLSLSAGASWYLQTSYLLAQSALLLALQLSCPSCGFQWTFFFLK